MKIYDVVSRILGPIKPSGDCHADTQRYQNLKMAIELVDRLVFEINEVAEGKDHHASSISMAGETADEFLKDLRESIN